MYTITLTDRELQLLLLLVHDRSLAEETCVAFEDVPEAEIDALLAKIGPDPHAENNPVFPTEPIDPRD